MRVSIRRWARPTRTLALWALLLPALLRPTSASAGIAWANFVRFGGITYVANGLNGGRALASKDFGPRYASVRYTLADTTRDPTYQPVDGDAAFVPVGTPVYTVQGYRPSFRLAIRAREGIVLFEADSNPRARRGADLLDIAGKVRALGLLCMADGMAPLATIADGAQLGAVVATILEARVDQRRLEPGPPTYVLAFSLRDGTVVARPYWSDAALLGRGILLPQAFRLTMAQGLRQMHASQRRCQIGPAARPHSAGMR